MRGAALQPSAPRMAASAQTHADLALADGLADVGAANVVVPLRRQVDVARKLRADGGLELCHWAHMRNEREQTPLRARHRLE